MLNRKGQNIAEYSILIALVIAAAVAMQTYVKRGIQGRIADAVDFTPNLAVTDCGTLIFNTKQYEPYYVESGGTVSSDTGYKEDITARGETKRTAYNEETMRANQYYEKTTYNAEGTMR